ncbi:GIN domain-containing protein [Pedobacter borealis]|uniref:GIN domain-containing protein n=1 Tax=Pedobacter borealis TaxID=475254 RepID=UPI000493AD74|nr:DUF2807 domain-containing protein [Pedobacter borealis]
MKTSNKLLISLAVLLIVIPIIVVAVNIKMNYVASTSGSFVDTQVANSEPFEKKTANRASIPIKTKFSTININNGKRVFLELHFIESEMYGVKVPEDIKDDIKFNVDNSGVLQIDFDDKLDGSHTGDTIVIVVYSPNIHALNLNNLSSVVLTARADTLSINMKRSGSLSLGTPITFSVNEKITRVINQTDIKQLNVNLDSASFYSSNSSYKNLNINCKDSSVDIKGDQKNSIDNLTINTFNTSEITLENVMINNISGDFSDKTKVQMPVKYLKQMFKK